MLEIFFRIVHCFHFPATLTQNKYVSRLRQTDRSIIEVVDLKNEIPQNKESRIFLFFTVFFLIKRVGNYQIIYKFLDNLN